MSMGLRCLVSKPCECGDNMQYRKRMFRGWRLECICGRCGPWRRYPETEIASPFPLSDSSRSPASVVMTTPAPPEK